MQWRKLFVTYEAIYDIVDAEEHIIRNFGTNRKERFHVEIQEEIRRLSTDANLYQKNGYFYRGYEIHNKPFPPAIIFYVIKEDGVHVLRVPREEYDWGNFFLTHEDYEYSYPDIKFI